MKSLKVFLYAILAMLLYSLADYFLYGLIGREMSYDPEGNYLVSNTYRIVAFLLILGICGAFYLKWDIYATLSVFVLWWTGVADFMYYGWFDGLKIFLPEYAGTAFVSEILAGLCWWLFFTPAGLVAWMLSGEMFTPLPGWLLIIQVVTGLIVSMVLSVKSYLKRL